MVVFYFVIGIGLLLWLCLPGKAEQPAAAPQRAPQKPDLEGTALWAGLLRQQQDCVAFFDALSAARRLPVVEVGEGTLAPGEFCLLAEDDVTRFGSRSTSQGGAGKRPARPAADDDQWPLNVGRLLLTNQRLLYLSAEQRVDIPYADLTALNPGPTSVELRRRQPPEPVAFALRQPILWSLLVKILAHHHFDAPELPEGVVMRVTGDSPLRLSVEVGTAQGIAALNAGESRLKA